MGKLVHDLIAESTFRAPTKTALIIQKQATSFAQLDSAVDKATDLFLNLGLQKSERVATFLEKRTENIVGMFSSAREMSIRQSDRGLIYP